MVICKSPAELEKMHQAGLIVWGALEEMRKMVKPGITTKELDEFAEGYTLAKKAHPALRCRDYPALLKRLRGAGIEVNEPGDIPGVSRCHVHDPFGNRIELIGE